MEHCDCCNACDLCDITGEVRTFSHVSLEGSATLTICPWCITRLTKKGLWLAQR